MDRCIDSIERVFDVFENKEKIVLIIREEYDAEEIDKIKSVDRKKIIETFITRGLDNDFN